jgi:hypothetical protein
LLSDDGTCSLDLLESASEYFNLELKAARSLIKEVALATSKWRIVAKKVGARSAEIDRMSSAFEHGRDIDRPADGRQRVKAVDIIQVRFRGSVILRQILSSPQFRRRQIVYIQATKLKNHAEQDSLTVLCCEPPHSRK